MPNNMAAIGGAWLIMDLTSFYKSHTFMHFMCFSTIILNFDESLQHIRLFNIVTVKSKGSD